MKYRIYCEPRPWPRTMGNGTRRFSPAWYSDLKAEIRNQMSKHKTVERFSGKFLQLYITVFVQKPVTTRCAYPSRGDVDNYAKAVMDALQRDKKDHESVRYWLFNDDRYVQALYVAKQWSSEPGYLIEAVGLEGLDR